MFEAMDLLHANIDRFEEAVFFETPNPSPPADLGPAAAAVSVPTRRS